MTDAETSSSRRPPLIERLRARRSEAIPWALFGSAVVALIVLGIIASSTASKASELEERLDTRGAELAEEKKEVEKLRAVHQQAEQKRANLAKDSEKLTAELAATKAANVAAKAAVAQAKSELLKELSAEIRRGEIVIKDKEAGLVLDVSDKVLFDTGQAEISERGKEVLKQVSTSLRRMRGHVFQVGGHTDNERIVSPEVRERFPTNWELSSARATQVVRYLSETCGVPGGRLVAAGYARYRPVVPNTSAANKARNRRIEIAVLREER